MAFDLGSPVSDTNPLPVTPGLAAGSATAAKQDTGNTSIASVDTKMTTLLGHVDGVETLLAAATPAGENLIGSVATPGDVLTFTPTLDTSIYADGDTLFDTTALASMFRVNGGRALVQSVSVIDADDQGVAFDLFFLATNVAFGTANAAPSISDANALASNLRRVCRIDTADYIDVGGAKIASKDGIGAMIEAAAGVTGGYLTAVTRGAPTYTASGLQLRIGLIWF